MVRHCVTALAFFAEERDGGMTLMTRFSLIALFSFLAACAPAKDDPRRKLGYVDLDATVERGFSRNEGFRGRDTLRTSRTSNKFGRSRQVARSSRRFNRRIDR